MSRTMRLLLGVFTILIGITLRTLFDTEPPTLVKPGETNQTILPKPQVAVNGRSIFAVGDSLTAGYQLSPEQSFPAQLQTLLKDQNITVINAGKSGDTSSQMRERFSWSIAEAQSGDIILLTAGANDGLQGLPLEQLENNLKWMISEAKNRSLVVIVGGMKLPPNYGPDYARGFEEIYPRIAQELNVLLIPFILEGVAANPSLNLSDGIHPNEQGYAIIANTIEQFLEEQGVLGK